MHRYSMKMSALATLGILVAACGDSGNGGSSQPGVLLNFATQPGTTAATRLGSLAEPYSVTDANGNTVTFTSVQLVLREIELKRADADVVCADGSNSDDGSSSSECEEVEFATRIYDLPLGPGVARALAVDVAPGSYDKLEFKVHKPESSDDAAFIANNPSFDGVSIRVVGTWTPAGGSAQDFTYTSDLDVEQEQEFVPPLAVVDGQSTDLTMFVSIDDWFRNGSGILLDPATANKGQPNEGVVKNNIESSFQAFEDEDRDGQDD